MIEQLWSEAETTYPVRIIEHHGQNNIYNADVSSLIAPAAGMENETDKRRQLVVDAT